MVHPSMTKLLEYEGKQVFIIALKWWLKTLVCVFVAPKEA